MKSSGTSDGRLCRFARLGNNTRSVRRDVALRFCVRRSAPMGWNRREPGERLPCVDEARIGLECLSVEYL